MDKKQIQKNLYDLEYNKILNQYNTVIILLGTLIIGIILSNYIQQTKLLTIFISGLLLIFFKRIFDKRLDEIKLKINEL